MSKYYSHYSWLNKYLRTVFERAGISWSLNGNIISAHGDKSFGYQWKWREHGVPYEHGTAIFLMSYCKPFSEEVRETEKGWVDVGDWVIENYDRFKHLFEGMKPLEDDEFLF